MTLVTRGPSGDPVRLESVANRHGERIRATTRRIAYRRWEQAAADKKATTSCSCWTQKLVSSSENAPDTVSNCVKLTSPNLVL
ncbi:hypothetical protein J6590_045300 [Homalodisca vitripennis]|nr:hypothetical protein J6590_045300 [Homalodisca vitripennis]